MSKRKDTEATKRVPDEVRRKLLRIGVYSAPVILGFSVAQFARAQTAPPGPAGPAPPVRGKEEEEEEIIQFFPGRRKKVWEFEFEKDRRTRTLPPSPIKDFRKFEEDFDED